MKKAKLRVLLVGNPNCGKTALFNRLTGSLAYVGNRSGVTVEKKSAPLRADRKILITDLPGVYSLKPYSGDEAVTVSELREGEYELIVNVVSAVELERGLELTEKLLSLKKPMLLAVAKSDIVERRRITVDTKLLSEVTGLSVFMFSSKNQSGIRELTESLVKAAKASTDEFSNIGNSVEPSVNTAGRVNAAVRATKSPRGSRADRIILSKALGFLIMLAVFMTALLLSFGGFTNYLSDCISNIFTVNISESVGSFLTDIGVSSLACGLVCDGIISGVGGVLAFLPELSVMFFCVSFIEESGYMARAAVISDSLMRRVGLSGKALPVLFTGMGCTASGLMSARILSDREVRKRACLSLPFITCTAKLPVLLMLSQSFFGGLTPLVIPSVYLIGWLCALVTSYLLSRFGRDTDKYGGMTDSVIELPEYRLPLLSELASLTLYRLSELLKKAGTVLLLASMGIWLLNTLKLGEHSMLYRLGELLVPLLKPLGFGNPQAASALICGTVSKESIISAFEVMDCELCSIFNRASAASFSVFVLLGAPCATAVATLKGELGSLRLTLLSLLLHLVVAWSAAYVTYIAVGSLI